jgi:hypothetical protein
MEKFMLKETIFEVFKEYKQLHPEELDVIKTFLEEVFDQSYTDNRMTIDTSLFVNMYNKWHIKKFPN